VVTWGAVKGAREQGAFILTLDGSPRHLQSSWERSATQFSWASFLIGFGCQFVLHAFRNASELSASIIPVRSQKYIDLRFVPLRSQGLALRPPLLPGFYPHSQGATGGPVHVGVRFQPGPITIVTGPGWLGCCHLFSDLQGSGDYPQSPEQGEWMSLLQTFPITNRPRRQQSIFRSRGLSFRDCVG
jgi:hypothetical protein